MDFRSIFCIEQLRVAAKELSRLFPFLGCNLTMCHPHCVSTVGSVSVHKTLLVSVELMADDGCFVRPKHVVFRRNKVLCIDGLFYCYVQGYSMY